MRAHKRFMSPASIISPVCILLSIALVTPASAFRPFDGTDADVTDLDIFEVEFGPVGAQWQGSQSTLIAPLTTLNYGFAKGWEANIQGEFDTPLSPSGPTTITQGEAFLKHVLREGSLQDKDGVSIATEFGFLLPDSTGNSGVGAHIAALFSQKWDWGTVHFNAQIEDTRDQHTDLFFSTIVLGPDKWKVQPGIEIYYENEIGQSQTFSGLFALLFPVREELTFDVAFRHAETSQYSLVGGTSQFGTNEIRAGVTFGFPLHLLDGAKH
jgi:hypothetical protein